MEKQLSVKRYLTWTLDALVQECTAFADWGEMVAAMANGYCPTLNGGNAYEALAIVCRRWGFKVYRDGKVS